METVIRVMVVYLFLMVSLRMIGKREFGQLSPLELVSLLLIPELVSNAIQGDDFSLVDAFVGVTTLLALTVLTSMLIHLSKTVEKVITAVPIVLVQQGTMIAENLNRERVTPDEIYTEMHRAGLERLEQVAWAILEPGGAITIVPRDQSETNNTDAPHTIR